MTARKKKEKGEMLDREAVRKVVASKFTATSAIAKPLRKRLARPMKG